jgi:hypothetical protein
MEANPLMNTSWEAGAAQLRHDGLVVCGFYDEETVRDARLAVMLLSAGPEGVEGATQSASLMYNGALSHASAFHGEHRLVAFKIYRTVIQVLFAHLERNSAHARRLELLPFQVHHRTCSRQTLDAWGFTAPPATVMPDDDIYLGFLNLNGFNMYLDVVPETHGVAQWGHTLSVHAFSIDPMVVGALGHVAFLPKDMRATMEEGKQTILVPPGHVVVYSSKLVVKEPRVDPANAQGSSVYIALAYRLTHSWRPLHADVAIDMVAQRPPVMHTGLRPVMYPTGDPFARPGIYRKWVGTARTPKTFNTAFLVEWPAADGKKVCMPHRIAEGLVEAGCPHPPYTDAEVGYFKPCYLALVYEWEKKFWHTDVTTFSLEPLPATEMHKYIV